MGFPIAAYPLPGITAPLTHHSCKYVFPSNGSVLLPRCRRDVHQDQTLQKSTVNPIFRRWITIWFIFQKKGFSATLALVLRPGMKASECGDNKAYAQNAYRESGSLHEFKDKIYFFFFVFKSHTWKTSLIKWFDVVAGDPTVRKLKSYSLGDQLIML